jgi:hypothetical protein
VGEFENETFSEARQIERLRKKVHDVSNCFEQPASVIPPAIRGFYRGGGPKAVERLLSQFRRDGQSFFGWLNRRGVDLSRVQTILAQLVTYRTEIAHGNMTTQVTISDAKFFLLTATQMVRLADRFVRESFR